jgi:hypothetical protein
MKRAFKIAGIVVVGLWMAYVTWRLQIIDSKAETACAWAYSVANPTPKGQDTQIFCPPGPGYIN